MSFAVIAIGTAHAIPPIVGALAGKSKGAVIVGTIFGGLIAIATGNPAYAAIDLLGVGVGTWIGLSIVKK